jgi:sarcosine oxidase
MSTEPSKLAGDVAIVGAGVFGAWTAYQLQRAGASVILIDQYGAGNNRASSGGETRVIRMGYGPDEIYTRSAQRSLELWREIIEQCELPLFHRTGVLWLTRDDDAYSIATLSTLERTGVVFQKLTRVELERAFPQIEFGLTSWAIFEPESGVLMARQGVRAVVKLAVHKGATYLNDGVTPPTGKTKWESVTTVGGRRIEAETFVFACGPWLPKIFPDLLGDVIHVTRQEVVFFGVPPGDMRFSSPVMPVWIDFNDLVYAIPDVECRGFKLAIDAHGPSFDPDGGERVVTAEGLEAARRHLSQRVPALARAPVLETRVCQYENTSNGDFLIDRHPAFENVWIAGGGSGHGFKHGPVVGECVAKALSSGGQVEPRFRLAAKAKIHHRQVF